MDLLGQVLLQLGLLVAAQSLHTRARALPSTHGREPEPATVVALSDIEVAELLHVLRAV